MNKIKADNPVYKSPWVRNAQQRLFQTIETNYCFPRATCRSRVNLMWDFLNETFGKKLHEGQIVFHAIASTESPGKTVASTRAVLGHLTLYDRTDLDVLSQEGIAGLRRKKLLRMAHEALERGSLLTHEDLAVILCSSRRTIRHDINGIKKTGIDLPTRGIMQDIGPGAIHKSKVVKMWLDGYEYMDIERRTKHSGTSVQRYLGSFSKVVCFHSNSYSTPKIREFTDMSERLVKEYLQLEKEYKNRLEANARLEQVLAVNPPLKKRHPHRKRRGREVAG